MGYGFSIDKSAGSEVLLCPDDEGIDNFGIEASDIAEMIEAMFYDATMGDKFTENDLVFALSLFDAWRRRGENGS